jgi:hypothetical protein
MEDIKIMRFGWGESGKLSSLTQYRREESKTVMVSHVNKSPKDNVSIWLKSFGMVSWAILIPKSLYNTILNEVKLLNSLGIMDLESIAILEKYKEILRD